MEIFSNIIPAVASAFLAGAAIALLMRVSGFLLVLAVVLIAVPGLWIAAPGHGPSIGHFIIGLVGLQAGYLGGAFLVAIRSRGVRTRLRTALEHVVDQPPHLGQG